MTTNAAVPYELRVVMHPTDFSAAREVAFAHALGVALNARGKFYILHTERAEPEEIDRAASRACAACSRSGTCLRRAARPRRCSSGSG